MSDSSIGYGSGLQSQPTLKRRSAMDTKATMQPNQVTQHTSTTQSRSVSQRVDPSWTSFPEPKGWALAWDTHGLTHAVEAVRANGTGTGPEEE